MSESREGDSGPPEPGLRPRAPTINIDNSAVDQSTQGSNQDGATDRPPPLPRIMTNDLQSDKSEKPTSNHTTSPTDALSAPSHESRESRPTSPHNVSSPTSKWPDGHHFLSVPNARKRGDSIDSEEEHSYAGDTAVPSSGSATEHSPGDRTQGDNRKITNDEEALKPDPGQEEDFKVEDNKFAFSPGQLNKLLNPKSLSAFHALGGLAGLEKGLRTNRYSGLSVDETSLDGSVSFDNAVHAGRDDQENPDPKPVRRTTTMASSNQRRDDSFSDRKRIFKDNRLPAKKVKSFWQLAWMAYKDKVLILLSAAAVISLALGIYQAATDTTGEARVQWVEGVAIMVAIIIVVFVGAANDYQKERQFVKLNKKKEDRFVKVIRSGKSRELSVYDILVGDVVHLEPGDLIPVDGVFVEGHNVKCDESSATGESDVMRKYAGTEVYKAIDNHESLAKLDPFIISGGKVSEGVGTFMVTSVGVNSSYGKTMMSLQDEGQTTPLQSKLNVLAEYIAKLGLGAGLLLFVVLFIKFLAQLHNNRGTPGEKGQDFLQIFIVAVTIVVVAVPEGLPLAVTLALAFATTRMLKDNNLVRLLRACETMGNATTICSDKTGTLTQNKMTVVAGTVGTSSRFGDKPSSDAPQSPASGKSPDTPGTLVEDVSANEFVATLAADVKELLESSIVLNSTAFEGEEDGLPTFIGSKTETALLSFSHEHLGMGSVNEERSNAEIAQLVPFDSGRKCMAVIIKTSSGKYRMLVKGASEILIDRCTQIIRDPTKSVDATTMTEQNSETLSDLVSNYASRSLRTIAMLYRDFEQWPPQGAPVQEDDHRLVVFDKIFKDMTFLGVVGIQDPLRPGVSEAVKQCQAAGVFVRMVTGDNIQTAKAIATECGIFTPGGVAMEGPKFRKLSTTQMDQIIPRLQVLARSSPDDKKTLVARLQKLGETVAVTGDGTNDAPALKTADVGFSMGIAGTEVAKEASAIILMDDNFASIVKAISWGRTVNDAVKKFLQFQITVNITAVVLTFVSAVASGSETSVLTAVQLLWVNLIMDTFAALALATDPPTPSMLLRKPEPKSAPLITLTMWKMIIGQAIYQLVVTFILNFAGRSILSYQSDREQRQLQTLIFNTFVWMQIFNQYNCRRLDNGFNVFEGMFKNYWFLGIQAIIMGGQVLIVFKGGKAFSTHPLNGAQWGYSVVLGALSMLVAITIRCIPDELIRKLIPSFAVREKTPQLLVSDEERNYEWNPILEEIREELSFLKKVRGGRLHNIAYKLQHPAETFMPRSRSGSRSGSRTRSSTNSLPQTPNGEHNGTEMDPQSQNSPESRPPGARRRSRSNSGLGAAIAGAGIIAGGVGGGWSPIEHRHSEAESFRFQRSEAHSGVEAQAGIEVHPDTKPDDPIITDVPKNSKLPPSQNPDLRPVFDQEQSGSNNNNLSLPGRPSRSHSRHSSQGHG